MSMYYVSVWSWLFDKNAFTGRLNEFELPLGSHLARTPYIDLVGLFEVSDKTPTSDQLFRSSHDRKYSMVQWDSTYNLSWFLGRTASLDRNRH